MRLLLLNTNPAVSRLIKLSADKAGYELDEFEDYGLVPLTTYDVILIDNELYDELSLESVKEQTGCDYIVYICQRGAKKPDTCNVALEKPFLPTDFLILLDKIKNVIASHKSDEEDEDLQLSRISQEDEEANAFDIDQIDALENEDDILPIDLLDEDVSSLDKKEEDDAFHFDDIGMDDLTLDHQEEAIEESSDISSEEKELKIDEDELSFNDVESIDNVEHVLEDFDFESEVEEEKETENEEESGNTSVLDKDDIDEVKQLLDESEDEDEAKEISELALDALDINKEDEELGKYFLDDTLNEEDDTLDEEVLALKFDDIAEEDSENVAQPLDEKELIEQVEEDDQEEIIDDFTDAIEEKVEEENAIVIDEDELVLPEDDVVMSSSSLSDDIDSLDDLNENLLKEAFGEEIDEEVIIPVVSEEKSEKVEVIRDEIESSIARSISSLAQSDILREALKGMRINISITFDEKE